MQVVATTRVRYAETDAMGIAYHSNYLVWFEVARTELFRAIGLPYTKFESDGLALAVVEANIRYRAPVKYDDLLELQAEVEEINNRKVVFRYIIRNQQNIACEGSTVHLFINRDGRSTKASGYPIWSEVQKIFEL